MKHTTIFSTCVFSIVLLSGRDAWAQASLDSIWEYADPNVSDTPQGIRLDDARRPYLYVTMKAAD